MMIRPRLPLVSSVAALLAVLFTWWGGFVAGFAFVSGMILMLGLAVLVFLPTLRMLRPK